METSLSTVRERKDLTLYSKKKGMLAMCTHTLEINLKMIISLVTKWGSGFVSSRVWFSDIVGGGV